LNETLLEKTPGRPSLRANSKAEPEVHTAAVKLLKKAAASETTDVPGPSIL
jgi:hypothetical protein